MPIKSSTKVEDELLGQGYEIIIGIDEAGRGPLAGPVVAAAVISKFKIQNSKLFNFVRDSKTLSAKQREILHDFIFENFYVGIGLCDHRTIDRINILEATYLAAKKALTDLIKKSGGNKRQKLKAQNAKRKTILLFDGNKKIPNLSLKQKAIINGDKLVKIISAASIVAKVTRDRIMLSMHEKYPQYHFHKHKGYGTKLHMEMLKKHGPCKIHRKSFHPVKNLQRI